MAWKNENKIKKKILFARFHDCTKNKNKKKKKRGGEMSTINNSRDTEISLRFHEACVRAGSRNQEELEEEEVIQW